MRSGFFNDIDDDRLYDASFFADYFASFIGDGVFPNPSSNLQVLENTQLTTIISAGRGWIKGYVVINDNDYTLQHDNSDGVLSRIDRVVMRLNFLERKIEVVIKKGVFASTPVAPSLQRDADYYELALADVFIAAGATRITQADITDLRLDTDLCGIVSQTVRSVDTETLFNQYQSWYNQMTVEKQNELDNWIAAHQQEFNDWFASIADILDENVAGNLLMLIQQNQADIRSMIKHKTNVTVSASGWTLNGERYEYAISDTDISANSIVDVNIQLDSLDNAKMLLSACNSSNGAVTLYASSIPDADLIIDYRITNEVI